jgi:hypothetical protein
LQINRGADIVAAEIDVALEFLKQIARGAIPQMMVRIDDRHRRIDRRLPPQGEPILADRIGVFFSVAGSAVLPFIAVLPCEPSHAPSFRRFNGFS